MHHNLFIARRERRIKQKEIAKEMHINHSTYSLKENGKAEFTLSEAFFLADKFEMTVDELFTKKEVNQCQ